MSQNVSMMWAYLVALTESTSVVTRYPRYSGTSTPCSGSRNALDIQENAQQSSKTCIVAAVTGVESRHYAGDSLLGTGSGTTVPSLVMGFLPITKAFGPSAVEVRSFAGGLLRAMRGRIVHRTLCACRPHLPALPCCPYSPHAGGSPSELLFWGWRLPFSAGGPGGVRDIFHLDLDRPRKGHERFL